tara:strand:+ start:221 stop:979 length:759 start_codon:yes stop_codon:yes gene_type:complete
MSEVTEMKDLKEVVNDDKLEDSFIDESELADNTEEEDHVTEYGEAKYWDDRYSQYSPFDWLLEYKHFKEAGMTSFFRKNDMFVMLGCGSARFSSEMYDDGYENIYNIDLSQVVINDEQAKNAHRVNMHYDVMDVQNLDFDDEQFDVSIDKSTMDCLFCCSGSTHIISNMMTEAWRTLKPGGLFMTISLHEEEKVLPYIQLDEHGNEFPWKKVEVLNVPNPGWKPGSEKSKTHCVIVAIKPAAKELLSMSKKE